MRECGCEGEGGDGAFVFAVEGEADVGLGGLGGGRAGSFACRVGCGRHGGARLGSRGDVLDQKEWGRGALDLMFPATKYLY